MKKVRMEVKKLKEREIEKVLTLRSVDEKCGKNSERPRIDTWKR